MTVTCEQLLDAAQIACDQGTCDQAATIIFAALDQASRELGTRDRSAFDERAARLLALADEGRRAPSRVLHVAIAGDSLALPRPENAKTYDPRSSPRLHPTNDRSYPWVLRDRLRQLHPGRDVVISNLSRASNGMPEIAADAYVSLFYLDPTAVVIHCGIVDCWPRGDDASAPPKTDLASFRDALQRFLALRREHCATKPVVFVGLAPTDQRWRSRLPGIEGIIDAYSRELSAVAEARTYFIDMRTIVDDADPYRTLHLDGIHLNERGHEELASAIAQRLRPETLYASFVPARRGGSTSSS